MSDPNDTGDVVLQQAQMLAFAVPGAGAGLAGVISIAQAFYDAMKQASAAPATYSTSVAIDDLAAKVDAALANFQTSNETTTVVSWQTNRADYSRWIKNWSTVITDAAAGVRLATTTEGLFLNNNDFAKTFTALGDVAPMDDDAPPQPGNAPAITRPEVANLSLYTLARTSYHALCMVMLQMLARSQDLDPDTQWLTVHSAVRANYEASLQAAVDHLTPISAMLDDAKTNGVAKAQAAAKAIADPTTDPQGYNRAFAQAYRKIRSDAFLDAVKPDVIDRVRDIIPAYSATLAAMQSKPLPANPPVNPGGAAGGLGPRAPKTARFLFESGATGWYPVLADSQVSTGSLVSLDAGSNDSSIYYAVGGSGVNGDFAKALTAATELQTVNDALVTAYDAKYGTGAHAADAAAARADRLTSLLVPVTAAPPDVGSTVYAILYTVGPKLSGPIVDKPGYKQLYVDALAAISAWNAKHPTIENFRVTMVSTGIYSSGPVSPMDDAAELIVQAVVDALSNDPLLASLTILVNSNEANGGLERKAFAKAAAARNVTASMVGFDLPLT